MIDVQEYDYMPILAVRPAEMNALEELPEKDKDIILPIIPLQGWTSAHTLEKAVERIYKAIENRPWIADINTDYCNGKKDPFTGEYPRPVYDEIEELTDPENNYKNWCDFIESLPEHVIPCLQTAKIECLQDQLDTLEQLDRGIAVRINSKNFSMLNEILACLKTASGNVLVIFDYEEVKDHLVIAATAQSHINTVISELGNIPIVISGSSFPSGFSEQDRKDQDSNNIEERFLFETVKGLIPDAQLIYSDRGSARFEKQRGGGGLPAPRIDYPLKREWKFVRREFEDPQNPNKDEAKKLYTEAAKYLITKSGYWDKKLKTWGAYLIELTAKGDKFGISNPTKATAARINIHLYIQAHYYDEDNAFYDSDEEWED